MIPHKNQTEIYKHTHTHTHTHVQTFGALRSVVGVASWAIATFHGSRRDDAFAFAVAAEVVARALGTPWLHLEILPENILAFSLAKDPKNLTAVDRDTLFLMSFSGCPVGRAPPSVLHIDGSTTK